MDNGFEEFRTAEIDVGMEYAEKTFGERLTRETLRVAGNQAGAIRKAQGVTPRVAAVQALRAYERRNRIDISYIRFERYIRAIAKMLSERSPRTRAKRLRDAEVAAIRAAS